MQEATNVHDGPLVLWLQWQWEGRNRLADPKGIQGCVGSAVTSAHQDTVMTRAAILQDRHRLSSPYEINFYEVGSCRQHVQTLVLIYPASTPLTLVRGREEIQHRHHIICACFPYLKIRLAHLLRQGHTYGPHRGRR